MTLISPISCYLDDYTGGAGRDDGRMSNEETTIVEGGSSRIVSVYLIQKN